MTQPFQETKTDLVAVQLRVTPDLVARMDQRREAVGMSRNAWAAAAIDWVLTNLPTGIPDRARNQVAGQAPPHVAGDRRVPR